MLALSHFDTQLGFALRPLMPIALVADTLCKGDSMRVHSESGFLSNLSIHLVDRERAGAGDRAAPTNDNPAHIFRGLSFAIAFQVAAALLGFGLWHLLRHLL